jgi:hypothetical protein
MTHPPHSSSHPAQLPALNTEHAPNTFGEDTNKQLKEKKTKKAAATSSGYPLEVMDFLVIWKRHCDWID